MGEEIASQPAAWATARDRLPEWQPLLPAPGERVAAVGCGTSWFMAEAYARLREGRGLGETDFFTASEFPIGRGYDRIVAISRSGTTTEVLQLMDQAASPTVAITTSASTPIAEAATASIVLDFADEQSVVQTLFATTALMTLRASLGESIDGAVAQARRVLDEPVADELNGVDQFTFLGQGWVHGLAREAALKMREAAQVWTESYPQMEYRHGPIAIAQPGRAVWILGSPVSGIVADAAEAGATVIQHPDTDPVAELIRIQRLAGRLAELRGLDVDHPRHLTRAVVLTGQSAS
jgi:fructoselysine-6-P-deglycase FrlB-like protein